MISQVVLSLLSVSVSAATVSTSSATTTTPARTTSMVVPTGTSSSSPDPTNTLAPECVARIKLNTKLFACGTDFDNFIFGTPSASNSTSSADPSGPIATIIKDLPTFCSTDCVAAFPQLSTDLQSAVCASSVSDMNQGTLTGKDAGALLTFVNTFACLKDGANFCLTPELAMLSSAITNGITNQTLGCSKCSALQVSSLSALVPTLPTPLSSFLAPIVTKIAAAQSTCPAIKSSAVAAEGMAILAVSLIGAVMMF